MNNMLRLALRKNRGLRQQVENMLLGDDGDVVEIELKKFITKRPCWVKTATTKTTKAVPVTYTINSNYLRPTVGAEQLTIGETDGTGIIAGDTELFPGYIDEDFVNYGINVAGKPTEKSIGQGFDLIKNGKYMDILGSNPPDSLFFQQDQVKSIVRDHAKWIPKNGALMVPFVSNGGRFVAYVYRLDGGLEVLVHRFSHDDVWYAERGDRFVLPQLKPSIT